MHRLVPLEKDYYLDNDDAWEGAGRSDDDDSGSSEDELQRMFADIAGVKLPSQKKLQMKHDRSFEAEMEMELDSSFRHHNAAWLSGGSNDAPRQKSAIKDDRTHDSDDKEPSTSGAGKPKDSQKREEDVDPALGLNDQGTESDEEFQMNEDIGEKCDQDKLFYDPDEDDANQNWVDSHRRLYQPNMSQQRPLPKSDAVLNCPACMTVLCLDCQRHEIYKTQYRAMFVMNCDVKRDELLYQPKSKRRGGAKKRKGDADCQLKSGDRLSADQYNEEAMDKIKQSSRPEDLFYPVVCSVCKTEVGVYDSDDVYHFFNTLASYA